MRAISTFYGLARVSIFAGLLATAPCTLAQTVLYDFDNPPYVPVGVTSIGEELYGAFASGWDGGGGAIFRINPNDVQPHAQLVDQLHGAATPTGPLLEYNGFLYGTTNGPDTM